MFQQQQQRNFRLSIAGCANATGGAREGLAKNQEHQTQRFWGRHFAIG
jgi:hypothetical protein